MTDLTVAPVVASPARALPTPPLNVIDRQAIRAGVLTRVIAEGEGTVRTASDPEGEVFAWDVAVLPNPGESVTIPLHVGELSGLWVGLREVSPAGDSVTFHLFVDGCVKALTFTAAAVDARRTVTQLATDAEHDMARALFREVTEHQRTRDGHAEWITQLVDAAHTYADRASLCEEFDDFMRNHDLPARSKEYGLSVTVTVRLTVSREATSLQEAIDSLTAEDLLKEITVYDLDWEAEEDD